MTLQRSYKIIHFPFFLYPIPQRFPSPRFFFNPRSGVTSHPGHCYRFLLSPFLPYRYLHASLLYQRIVSTATTSKTKTSTTSRGKTCVALARVWIFFLFSVLTHQGEKIRLGSKEGVERERRARRLAASRKNVFAMRERTLALVASPSPSHQLVKRE